METPSIPVIHNPAKLYQEKLENDRKAKAVYQRPATAPRDKIRDLHTEPEWLIPELRSWTAIPVEQREIRIRNVMAADERVTYTKPVKEKCLRFILTQETERKLLILIVNYIAPKTQE